MPPKVPLSDPVPHLLTLSHISHRYCRLQPSIACSPSTIDASSLVTVAAMQPCHCLLWRPTPSVACSPPCRSSLSLLSCCLTRTKQCCRSPTLAIGQPSVIAPLPLPSLLPASRAKRNITIATLSYHLTVVAAINLKIAIAPAHPLFAAATIFLFSHSLLS
ncbi:hypothetical protein GW17_00001609 [Ensete ventricosum]|nr:hypothetical protein GW17_00001609 [Ensete ventricosum]